MEGIKVQNKDFFFGIINQCSVLIVECHYNFMFFSRVSAGVTWVY